MMIALDDSMITYTLRYALASDNSEEVNYICNRIAEAVPGMQLKHVAWCQQDIEKWLGNNDPDYLKSSPIRRLQEVLTNKRRDFKE
jgi:hypothetical protein